jgi:hypothetical protein
MLAHIRPRCFARGVINSGYLPALKAVMKRHDISPIKTQVPRLVVLARKI